VPATLETVDLLQQLIRNGCVNTGQPESGQEVRSTDLLRNYLEGAGLDIETYEPVPGRVSLVSRIEGSEAGAPALCLMGHTDVVPANATGWHNDPFGGELIDDEVWGRGAVDMLNVTASMAVSFKHLKQSGFRPRGTLIYLAVADEEAGGAYGAEWLTEHEYDAIRADYVVTESGGLVCPTPAGRRVVLTTAEKGIAWRRLRVSGTPGHGSMPYRSDNALVKAAQVVTRLASYVSPPQITEQWRGYVELLPVTEELKLQLVDPARVTEACAAIADPRTAKVAHACTHRTMSPNVVSGGQKTNVIPDLVEIELDVRTLPGETGDDIDRDIRDALGDLSSSVEIERLQQGMSSSSPWDSPLRDAIERATRCFYPDASLVPRMTSGGTDARFYRGKGAVAYGFGLFSEKVSLEDFSTRFHGNDERVDVESLDLTTRLWTELATDFLG
jgi:acetylornithine deacetylase/succinyl-diaminopimelate desuccinylase-like protein